MTGKRIDKYLRIKGIPLSLLADRSGIGLEELTDICQGGEVNCISYYCICKALALPLDTFLK